MAGPSDERTGIDGVGVDRSGDGPAMPGRPPKDPAVMDGMRRRGWWIARGVVLGLLGAVVLWVVLAWQNPVPSQPGSIDALAAALERAGTTRMDWRTTAPFAVRDVQVPADRLWAEFARADGWPGWWEEFSSARLSGGWRTGSVVDGTGAGGRRLRVEVDAVEPGLFAVLRRESGDGDTVIVWLFEPLANGRTRVTYVHLVTGWRSGVVKPVVYPLLDARVERSVDELVSRARER